jgi:hypothetical protein
MARVIEQKTREFESALWCQKETYFRTFIEEMSPDDIWPVTKWWQGTRRTIMLALKGQDSVKITDSMEKAKVLHRAWFPVQEDRSITLTVRILEEPDIPRQENCSGWLSYIMTAFKKPAARKALGITGIKYMHYREIERKHLIKVLVLVADHIEKGFSPQSWKEQIVTVLAKPDRLDFSVPKAYRPISLLECLSKTAERAIAERMKEHVVQWNLAQEQHIAKRGQGTETAFAVLATEIAKGKHLGLQTAILKFDIQGFFDHIHQPTLLCILRKLRFALDVVRFITQHIS